MTHHIVISSTLSASAREAMTDQLSMSIAVHDLLDPSSTWTLEDARSAARELTEAGYGHINDRDEFVWDIVPQTPAQLPTDNLDELAPAVDLVDRIVRDAMAQRSPDNPNPRNPLGVSWGILLQLQNVLRLAVYGQQGRLQHADVNRQLPAVATMLARAVRAEVV